MVCKKCNNEIPADATYCAYCGSAQKESSAVSSTLLFVLIVIFFLISLTVFLINKLDPSIFSGRSGFMLYSFLMLARVLAFLLIPFSFKQFKYKLISLLIISPALIWISYLLIKNIYINA